MWTTFLKRLQILKQEWQEKPSWDQANRRQKLGLVWRIRKKISQIIKDYFYFPFFLLITLWGRAMEQTMHSSFMGPKNPFIKKKNQKNYF
jgi:hypothetical protein